MNKLVKNVEKNAPAKNVNVVINKTTKLKKVVIKLPSNYRLQVLNPHKAAKNESKTVGGARAILLALHESNEITLPSEHALFLRESKKDAAKYKIIVENIRANKQGMFSEWLLRQALYRVFKVDAKKVNI